MTQVAVLGAGAVGSMFGGLIAAHDPAVELRLWARGEHGRRMRAEGGLNLIGPWGTKRAAVRVCDDPRDLRGSDLVLLTVKSQDTAATLEATAREIGTAPVVSLQNGVNQRVMEGFLVAEQCVVGMTATNMAIPEPGVVRLQRDGVTVIGPASDRTPAAATERALAILRRSALRIESQQNIVGIQYNKVAMNTIGYTSVLSRSDFLRECILDRDGGGGSPNRCSTNAWRSTRPPASGLKGSQGLRTFVAFATCSIISTGLCSAPSGRGASAGPRGIGSCTRSSRT